jgi:hypothetical protein
MDLTWLALTVGVLAMLVIVVLGWSILRETVGPRRMEKVAGIEDGAIPKKQSFNLSQEFKQEI